MAIFGSSFTYNGKSSDDYGVMLCAAEALDSIPMGLTREVLKGEITSKRPVANWYNTKYSDVLTFEITITKNEKDAFTREEVRNINAWLTGPRTPTLLFFDDYEDEAEQERINYYGVFTDVNNSYCSGLVMLTYTFTSNAPYGWSNEYIYQYPSLRKVLLNINNGILCMNEKKVSFNTIDDSTFYINNNTDELDDFVYPLIQIDSAKGTEITIINESEIDLDDLVLKKFSFTFPDIESDTKSIYIDSKYHLIYYKKNNKKYPLTLAQIGWTSDMLDSYDKASIGFYWPRLVPGENEFTISGNCKILVKFRCPRKVGAY